MLFQKAETALLEEKSAKLFGITRILDNKLKGTYDDILSGNEMFDIGTREEKINILNNWLKDFTDSIAASFPGVGVGYYSRELDAILCYGPSEKYYYTVGVSVDDGHIGRKSMEQKREIVGVGSMVRGEIMNCVRPLVRNGEVIGFTWANETIEDIYRQLGRGARELLFSSDMQPVLGLTGLLLFCSRILALDNSAGDSLSWAVKQVNKYLETFLNSLNIGIVIADMDDRVVFTNRGLSEILQTDIGSLHYQYYSDYRFFLDRLGFKEISNLSSQLAGNDKRQYISETTISYPSGQIKNINYFLVFLKNDDFSNKNPGENQIQGTVILFEDLEKVREEERKMERASKLATLGELSSSIVHEIRNPLSVVLGSLQLLPGRIGDREFIYSFLRIATQELTRVNNSLESLLDFARFSQPYFSLVDINELVENIIEFFSVTSDNQKVEFEKDLYTLPAIEADENQIKQALINIILNGIQSMSGGGTVKLTTRYRQGDKFVKIIISDTGTGINDRQKSYIFDAFYSTKEKGTGLGLALVHRVVDEHQGIIEFNSIEGQGTSFYLHLPVKQFNWLND